MRYSSKDKIELEFYKLIKLAQHNNLSDDSGDSDDKVRSDYRSKLSPLMSELRTLFDDAPPADELKDALEKQENNKEAFYVGGLVVKKFGSRSMKQTIQIINGFDNLSYAEQESIFQQAILDIRKDARLKKRAADSIVIAKADTKSLRAIPFIGTLASGASFIYNFYKIIKKLKKLADGIAPELDIEIGDLFSAKKLESKMGGCGDNIEKLEQLKNVCLFVTEFIDEFTTSFTSGVDFIKDIVLLVPDVLTAVETLGVGPGTIEAANTAVTMAMNAVESGLDKQLQKDYQDLASKIDDKIKEIKQGDN